MFRHELQWGLEITQNIDITEWGLRQMKHCTLVSFLPNADCSGRLQVVDLCLLTDLNPSWLFLLIRTAPSSTFEYLYEP